MAHFTGDLREHEAFLFSITGRMRELRHLPFGRLDTVRLLSGKRRQERYKILYFCAHISLLHSLTM